MFNPHNDQGFPFGMGMGRGRGFGADFGRERFGRGHLNTLILEIINERPRHGYDVIKAIEEKFYGFYAPSAGSVYPILQSLEDQGFVTSSTESGKKVYTITEEGKKELAEHKDTFAHMRERFAGMERFQGLMGEMKQTMHFMFGKLREKGIDNPETIKKLRIALAHFKSEVEEIVLNQQENQGEKKA